MDQELYQPSMLVPPHHLEESLSQEAYLRYQSLFGYRALTANDMQEIMAGSPRPLGELARIVHGLHLPEEPQLELGHGILLLCQTDLGRHAVSLFRSLDGRYIFYDSAGRNPPDELYSFVLNNNIPEDSVIEANVRLQHRGLQTCAYHAITFLEYATSTNIVDHQELISTFVSTMGPNTDYTALLYVQYLLSEFQNDIDLSYGQAATDLHLITNIVEDHLPKLYIEYHQKRLSDLQQKYSLY